MVEALENPLILWLVVVPITLVITYILGSILSYFLALYSGVEKPRLRDSFGIKTWFG
jgi:hypothetical protein